MEFADALAAAATVLAGTFAVAWAATGRALIWLRRRAILDRPNERSSHTIPTPRGGGWGVMAALVPAWLLIGLSIGAAPPFWILPIGLAALIAVSWIDDRRGLGPAPRFLIQIAAVVGGLAALPEGAGIFQGLLPLWLDRIVAAIGWLWFVNLFNFMDGIDGIAGGEAASIGVGVAVVAMLAGLATPFPLFGLAVSGAAAGFLLWNWHPAKLFMGDVGSIPLGYALGWLLLTLAAEGAWAAAALLPAYFLADATLTLLHRALRRERLWQAHREHFYQRAVQNGRRHDQVVGAVLLANLILVVLAAVSLTAPWSCVAAGAVTVILLLRHLAARKEAA